MLDELARDEHRQLDASSRGRSSLDEPPSIDAREITDKGSLNQKIDARRTAPRWSRSCTRAGLASRPVACTWDQRPRLGDHGDGPRTVWTDQ